MLRAGGKRLLVLGFEKHAMDFPSGEARGYHMLVMDHYNNTRIAGSFDKNNPAVGTGSFGCPRCNTNLVILIKYKNTLFDFAPTFEIVERKQLEEELAAKNTEIPKHLSVPPLKVDNSMFAVDAIKAAIKDYKAKRDKLRSKNGVSTAANTEKDTEDA